MAYLLKLQMKKIRTLTQLGDLMFSNYFRVVIRNLLKNKVYTSINVFGLAIGITCCIIIGFYILQETSYDSFYPDSEKIYRVTEEITAPEGKNHIASSHIPVADALRKDYPEIEEITRIFFFGKKLLKANDIILFQDDVAFVDSTFLNVLSIELITGDPVNSLKSPNNILISKAVAKKFFGNTDPIGKSITYDNFKEFNVAGVFSDFPVTSHFNAEVLIPFKNLYDSKIFSYTINWGLLAPSYTYVKLHTNTSVGDLEKKCENFISKYTEVNPGTSVNLKFQSLLDIHLHSHLLSEITSNNSIKNIAIITTIGLFILLIASINYMNLSTARATKRAKEVGIRKVMGAIKGQLMIQFLSESIILTSIAGLISLVLVEVSHPIFSKLLMQEIIIDYFSNLWIPVGILGFILTLGVIAGSYPALYLSHFLPVKVLSNKPGSKNSSAEIFRKMLVVSQFAICILLIIGVVVIKGQLNFMINTNMGFDKNHNIVVPLFDRSKAENYELIKNKLNDIDGINGVTACLSPIVKTRLSTTFFPNAGNEDDRFDIVVNSIDYDYVDHFKLKLIAGRTFDPKFPNDKLNTYVITENLVKKLGLSNPEDAIGKSYRIGLNDIKGTVIGVVKNFHNSSLLSEKSPVIMLYWPNFIRSFVVKVNSNNISKTLSKLEKTWREMIPNYPFEYTFLDETINEFYTTEAQTAETLSVFSFIAIIIGCLGLFGLSAFSIEQKTKEIGIRKVVGASVPMIVILLNKQFVKLILLSNLIAWPIAYYLMSSWLENYPYKINLEIWIFIIAATITICVAILTVSYQSIKAALVNPVKSLKYE